jgi:hypothetical protein
MVMGIDKARENVRVANNKDRCPWGILTIDCGTGDGIAFDDELTVHNRFGGNQSAFEDTF